MSAIGISPRWLVTGCAGFIGSHACDYLLECGHEIIGIDDLSSGSQSNIDLLSHKFSSRFTFFTADISDASAVAKIFEQHQPTHVLHLAAMVSIPLCQQNPSRAHEVNVSGFYYVLEQARLNGVQKFIYASSSAVYGKQPEGMISEDALLAPLSFYGMSKLVNELYAAQFATPTFQCLGLRLFNIFGARQPVQGGYAAVIPLWQTQLLKALPISIFGDGLQTRDFCHVSNVSHLIEIASGFNFTESHNVLNVGTGEAISLLELYDALTRASEISNAPAPLFAPPREGDIRHSCANIEKAVKLLGYKPNVDLIKLLRNN